MCEDGKDLAVIESGESATDLLKLAVSQLGGDGAEAVVAAIEKLVELELKVNERNAKKAFFNALAEFQQNCPQIKKTSTTKKASSGGSGFGYNYAELDQIQKTIKEHLYSRGLSFTWDTKMVEDVIECTCILRHKDGYETTSSFSSKLGVDGKMNEVQKHGATLTYLKRYTLISILGLTTTDSDTDGVSGDQLEAITAGQADEIEAKVDELKMNKPKFLKFFGVEDFAEIRKADYKRALGVLEQKEQGA